MKYDIFLSYKSEDREWVEKLKIALQKRGVSVWLDKDTIRPGDLFAQALENGILNSRVIAIIVTPQSMKSKWVQEEYYRALSLSSKNEINIIPCILQHAEIPGFLSSRQYIDFTDNERFELNVDHLVFPGITGKRISVESFTHDIYHPDWEELRKAFKDVLGYAYISGLSSSRMSEWVHLRKRNDDIFKTYPFVFPGDYSVIIIDMTTHGVKNSVEFILECRNSKENIYNNIVFVFYHPPDFFKSLTDSDISEDLRKRFSHYYVIEKTHNTIALQQNVRNTWNFVLQDLMRIERVER